MLNSLINLPPELKLEALKIIAKTEGLEGLKNICFTNRHLMELCNVNKNILIREADKTRLSKLFKYIERHGAEGIQNQETEGFCNRNKDIINDKIDEYLVNHPQIRANIFEIKVELNETEFDQDVDFIVSDSLQDAFNKWGYRHFMRRGDILFNSIYPRYRNDGKCLFDGEKLVGLEGDFNEYGHVSREFLAFIEFPPDYWDDLAYNGVRISWTDFSQINVHDMGNVNRYDNVYRCYEVEFEDKRYNLLLEQDHEVPEDIVLIYNDIDENEELDYIIASL